jgi:hypothetical protein
VRLLFGTWILISGFAVLLRSYQGMPLHCLFNAAFFTFYVWAYWDTGKDREWAREKRINVPDEWHDAFARARARRPSRAP